MSALSRTFIAAAFFVTALIPTLASAQTSAIDVSTALAGVRLFDDAAASLEIPTTDPVREHLLNTALTTLAAPASPNAALGRRQAPSGDRDSVLDGILIGAGIGAAGGALGALLWCQGDYKGECDDEPGQGPLIGTTALIGAGAGAVLGWVFDQNRSSHQAPDGAVGSPGPMLVVAPVASPSVRALHFTLRY